MLEQQALEWQQERDDFTKEIDRLNAQIRDKEKEIHTYSMVVKEVCCQLLTDWEQFCFVFFVRTLGEKCVNRLLFI